MLDDIDLDIPEEETPPRRTNNRNFLWLAGVLGAIMLLALVGMAAYALFILPRQQAAQQEEAANAPLTSTALAKAAQVTNTPIGTNTSTPTSTPTATPPPTETPTSTPITPVFTSEGGDATATFNALLTQAALSQTEAAGGAQTPTPTQTPSSLPDAGFADGISAPDLLAAAALLLLVILLSRRLRSATN